jgi:hypothetical protein
MPYGFPIQSIAFKTSMIMFGDWCPVFARKQLANIPCRELVEGQLPLSMADSNQDGNRGSDIPNIVHFVNRTGVVVFIIFKSVYNL